MSVLEIWKVEYRRSGEDKTESFNWYEFERLKEFVEAHDVTSIVFNATGLPESSAHSVKNKNVYEETVSKEEVSNLSQTWIDERRKGY